MKKIKTTLIFIMAFSTLFLYAACSNKNISKVEYDGNTRYTYYIYKAETSSLNDENYKVEKKMVYVISTKKAKKGDTISYDLLRTATVEKLVKTYEVKVKNSGDMSTITYYTHEGSESSSDLSKLKNKISKSKVTVAKTSVKTDYVSD